MPDKTKPCTRGPIASQGSFHHQDGHHIDERGHPEEQKGFPGACNGHSNGHDGNIREHARHLFVLAVSTKNDIGILRKGQRHFSEDARHLVEERGGSAPYARHRKDVERDAATTSRHFHDDARGLARGEGPLA